jgi:hypothetical protein
MTNPFGNKPQTTQNSTPAPSLGYDADPLAVANSKDIESFLPKLRVAGAYGVEVLGIRETAAAQNRPYAYHIDLKVLEIFDGGAGVEGGGSYTHTLSGFEPTSSSKQFAVRELRSFLENSFPEVEFSIDPSSEFNYTACARRCANEGLANGRTFGIQIELKHGKGVDRATGKPFPPKAAGTYIKWTP